MQKEQPIQLSARAKGLTGDNANIPLKHFDLTIRVLGELATTELEQYYTNDNDYPINVEYLFPVMEYSCLLDFTAVTNDEVFVGKVDLKAKVEEKQQQLKNEGLTHTVVSHFKDHQDILRIEIGNLGPRQTLRIKLTFSLKLERITSSACKLFVPVVLLDRPTKVNSSNQAVMSKKAKMPKYEENIKTTLDGGTYTFTFKIIIFKDGPQDIALHCMTTYSNDDFTAKADAEKVMFSLNKPTIPNNDVELLFKRISEVQTANPDKIPNRIIAQLLPFKGDYSLVGSSATLPWCASATFIIPPKSRSFLQQSPTFETKKCFLS